MINSPTSERMLTRYGLAMYHAQCLEKQIQVMVGMVLNSSFSTQSSEERKTYMESFDTRTLGQLFKQMEKRIKIPDKIKEKSAEILDVRNQLAHSFFFKFSDFTKTDEGCNKLIIYLDSVIENLIMLDDYYSQIATLWSGFHGPPILFSPNKG